MPDMFDYDAFLSYSHADRETVHDLAERLRKRGVRVWLDTWEMDLGAPIASAVQRGLQQSRVIVPCMSEAYFASAWGEAESQAVLFRDPTNEQRRILPILLESVEAPPLLAQFLYLDWRTPSEVGIDRLARALHSLRPSPTGPSAPDPEVAAVEQDATVVIALEIPAILRAAISSDGARALSGSHDGTVRVWDLRAGTCEAVLEGHTGMIEDIVISADSARALLGSQDGTVRVWDLRSGTCEAVLEGHSDAVESVAISADGARALSGSQDGTIRVWDLHSGTCEAILKAHSDWAMSLVVSADGTRALSGSIRGNVRVWDLRSGTCEAVLEGHTEWVASVAISADGTRALSGSYDGTVRVWDLRSGTCEAVLEGHSDDVESVAISADGARALSGSDDGTVRVWDLRWGTCQDVLYEPGTSVLATTFSLDGTRALSVTLDGTFHSSPLAPLGSPAQVGSSRVASRLYTNAKVALVGESGVGKSGLRIRLAEGNWRETESTHGMDVCHLDLPNLSTEDTDREVWLWDFAGQPDYRLVHQLFLDDIALALVVVDPQRDDPFAPLAHWEQALDATESGARLLIAARCDRGGFTISDAAVTDYLHERGYAGPPVKTAAKTGEGCADLRSLIAEHVDWDRIPYTSTTKLFKALKDAVLEVRSENVRLLQVAALQQRLRLALPDLAFTTAELRTVVGLLAGQGVVRSLAFGDFVLLHPELINSYASAVVRAARNHTDEIGSVAERDVLDAHLSFEGVDRLQPENEQIVLRELVGLLLDRALCLREETERGAQLVFPSYFRRERPTLPEQPEVVVMYRFSGPLDEIYSTLVVRLHHTEAFEKDRLWRHAADFKTAGGRLAGLHLHRLDEGQAELRLHFGEDVPVEVQVVFIRYVHSHLQRKAKDIVRVRMYRCPKCGEPLAPERGQAARAKGRAAVRCDECDRKVPLMDLIEQHFESPKVLEAVRRMDREAQIQLDTESMELILVGEAMIVAATAGQIFRPLTVADHGIDGEIEFKVNGEASGRRVYLQLKSGDSHLRYRKRDGTEVFTIKKPRHARYWTEQPAPVMLVVRTSDGETRWMDISAYLDEHGPDTKQVTFDGEPFTPQTVVALRNQICG